MSELWSIDVPWACFGVVAEGTQVVEAAPIAGWAVGKPLDEVLVYFIRRGGKVEHVSDYFAIVSGGQTGADRGGLYAAIEMDVSFRGWVPLGRRAEDGTVPDCFFSADHMHSLKETKQDGYILRTELNVADSGATVIFTWGPLTPGSKMTYDFAMKQGKPVMWIDLSVPGDYATPIAAWIQQHNICELNVAGSRESKAPGIQEAVKAIIMQVLARVT